MGSADVIIDELGQRKGQHSSPIFKIGMPGQATMKRSGKGMHFQLFLSCCIPNCTQHFNARMSATVKGGD